MSKQILVLSTSLRTGGNSDRLADAFVRGAQQAGHWVEKVSLAHCNIGFCRWCIGFSGELPFEADYSHSSVCSGRWF